MKDSVNSIAKSVKGKLFMPFVLNAHKLTIFLKNKKSDKKSNVVIVKNLEIMFRAQIAENLSIAKISIMAKCNSAIIVSKNSSSCAVQMGVVPTVPIVKI